MMGIGIEIINGDEDGEYKILPKYDPLSSLGVVSRPETRPRGLVVISHFKSEGSKCETTQTFNFITELIPSNKYPFRVQAHIIISPFPKFHTNKTFLNFNLQV